MKTKISYLLSFAIMVVLFILILYLGFELSIRSTIVKKNLNSINFYDKAYENIKKEISDYVVNEDVLKDYLDSINKDMIIKDIDILINKGEVDHTDKFYKIIEKYDSNKEICELYSKNVNSIYKNNLFPSKEFGIINVFKLRQDFIPFFIIFIALLMTMSVILKCISNKKKYFDIAIMGTGILTSMLILIRHYLKGLYYTNDYFTLFIRKIIDTNVVIDIIIFVLFFSTILIFRRVLKMLKNNNKKLEK